MTLIAWDQVGERRFEAGVDRAVLYPLAGPGVPWNGLLSVKEKASGDAPQSYYFDGVKYIQVPSATEYVATLEAFTYPDEFEECDGSVEITTGFFATNQPQKQFGLCYRTLIGNDVESTEHGYKLHLVYNALATPAEKPYSTLSNPVTPSTFSWEITTTPVVTPGFKPGAHFIINSLDISPYALEVLEGILYGAEGDPMLPPISEILDLPFTARPIWVIATADFDLLPPEALDGDLVFVIDEEAAYCIGPTPTPLSREVWVLTTGDPIPEDALPDDLVYYWDTGVIYRYEGA